MMHRIKLLAATVAVAGLLGVSGPHALGGSEPAPSRVVADDSGWQSVRLAASTDGDSGWQ